MSGIDHAAIRRWRKQRLEAGQKANPVRVAAVNETYYLHHAGFIVDRRCGRSPGRCRGGR
jgi:hypothetical protein